MSFSRSNDASRARWVLAGAGACAAGLVFSACSSPFSGCESARECGPSAGSAGQAGQAGQAGESDGSSAGGTTSVGSGGEAGAVGAAAGESSGGDGSAGAPVGDAGAGGAAPEPECVHDSDCSDQLACNGAETCLDGVCMPGVLPCANPEPAHCDAVCKELNGAASCTVQGQDKDKDTYLSSACTVKPGTDCNDADAAIHPGATEVCDGIDHNCNGKIGVNDALPLSGTTVAIGPSGATRGTPSIAWATDKSAYGVVYYDATTSSTSDLYFETVDKTGTVTHAPAPFNDTRISSGSGVSFTWGGDRFGASWVVSGAQVQFRTIDSSGTMGATLPVFSSSYLSTAGLARVADGNWAVLFWGADPGAGTLLNGTTVSAAGALGSTNNISNGYASSSSIAASGSNFVVGFVPAAAIATAAVWGASLTPASAVPLSIAGRVAVIGSGPNGFAIAVTPISAANPPQLYAFGPTGAALCGPVNIADKNFTPAAVVGTAKGYLVVSSGLNVRAQEVLSNCTLGTLFTVDAGSATNVGVAGSAAGYGVVWQGAVDLIPKRRVFGPNFCN